MSRMYDTVEPSVIDDNMIMKAVEEQGPKDEAGRIAKEEGFDLDDVFSLRLDFKNILKIDNLWTFKNLTKLQLDNNIIEKIEGLETLTKLVWLDLSFNNIEVIEGLDTLTELLDFTLFNNRITKIENMDNLKKLQIFSIGNNDLKELDQLVYLRRFKELRALNLKGNVFCEQGEYEGYAISFLPQLDYLDYKLIDQEARLATTETYQIAIDEIVDNERKAQIIYDEEEKNSIEFKLHQKAFVQNMNGSWLFDQMYAEDSEGTRLNEMPGVDEIIGPFRDQFTQVCRNIFKFGMTEKEKREEEVTCFWQCVNNTKEENKAAGVKHIAEFLEFKMKIFQDIAHTNDQKVLEAKVSEYNEEVSMLWDNLMGLELQLVDQLEEVVKEFERNLQDLLAMFVENIQGYLAQCRELENQHNEKMIEIALITLEKVMKSEMEQEISEELRMFFVDKDTVTGAVTASHDIHLLKIDNKEDDIVTRANQWVKNLIADIHETEEDQRNRSRVIEINNLIDHLREEIDNIDIFQSSNY